MAEIFELVQFRNGREPVPEVHVNLDGVDAEIVIFPGVRMERQSVDLSLRHQDVATTKVAATVKKASPKRPRSFPKNAK